MPLVAGVDSSTQACKVVICEAETGRQVRNGRSPHPNGTEIDPDHWWRALESAIDDAGGISDVVAISVAAQQHGLVCLDDDGTVIRPAILWNDTRSATAAEDLIADLGSPEEWADAVGLVPVASFTVTKLRWMSEHEPDNTERTTAVCLPHDWLTWKLRGELDPRMITTDRGDASGTGYWSARDEDYRKDLLELAFGKEVAIPSVLGPSATSGVTPNGAQVGAGTGDNAAAALGLAARPGDVIVSIGTSGVVTATSEVPTTDPTGTVAGFADATGRYLPLVATLNAARVLDAAASILGVDHARLSELALNAPPGADGLVLVPYLEGERTPNRPDATGALHGVRLDNSTPAHIARAAIEGLLCGLADALDALAEAGGRLERVILIGGGAASEAVRQIAPAIFGAPVEVPVPGEYVALGAARQAAWAHLESDHPPEWQMTATRTYETDPTPQIRDRYRDARDRVMTR